jgi:hypothetical protein
MASIISKMNIFIVQLDFPFSSFIIIVMRLENHWHLPSNMRGETLGGIWNGEWKNSSDMISRFSDLFTQTHSQIAQFC